MTILKRSGDAIEGERVAIQFRKISHIQLVRGTSAHRAQQANLRNAYCVIEEEYEYVSKQSSPPSSTS